MSLDRTRRALGLLLIGGGTLLAIWYLVGHINPAEPAPSFYGPLLPTRSSVTAIIRSTQHPIVTLTPTPVVYESTPTLAPPAAASLYTTRERLCAGVPFPEMQTAALQELPLGWYLNWRTSLQPEQPAGVEFAQMVRVWQGRPTPDLQTIASIAQHNPGALWLIGNEMDVIWQDNATPDQYAAAYQAIYAVLKQSDPRSRVAIGGITQPSPLRLHYLEQVLDAYRRQFGTEMPIDVWNVHNFMLPEQRGSWGVDIPPGIDATRGLTYTIEDHGDLEIFKQQIVDFRRWLAAHGYRDKELLVTEYGILMYPDYGFEYPRVRDFMLGTFEFFRTATDDTLGMPADGNRLVQRWCWYSLSDITYPTGNLIDYQDRTLTPLGRDFKAYLAGLP
jgi:hypothetical protein